MAATTNHGNTGQCTFSAGPKPREMRMVISGRAARIKSWPNEIIKNDFHIGLFRPGSTRSTFHTVGQQDACGRKEGRSAEVRMGTLNVGTMTDKRRELADMMVRKEVDIFCV